MVVGVLTLRIIYVSILSSQHVTEEANNLSEYHFYDLFLCMLPEIPKTRKVGAKSLTTSPIHHRFGVNPVLCQGYVPIEMTPNGNNIYSMIDRSQRADTRPRQIRHHSLTRRCLDNPKAFI
jgi:hypothetical protein